MSEIASADLNFSYGKLNKKNFNVKYFFLIFAFFLKALTAAKLKYFETINFLLAEGLIIAFIYG